MYVYVLYNIGKYYISYKAHPLYYLYFPNWLEYWNTYLTFE